VLAVPAEDAAERLGEDAGAKNGVRVSGVEARLAILGEREANAWGEYLADTRSVAPNGYEAMERRSWRRLIDELADVRRLRRAAEFELQHAEPEPEPRSPVKRRSR
jgi:hypothetical protein